MESSKTKQKIQIKKRTKDMIFIAIMAALPLLQYFVFYVCVNFNSIIMAFQKNVMDPVTQTNTYVWLGLDNFSAGIDRLFGADGMFFSCIKNSFIYYLCSLFVGTTLSLIFSYYIFKNKFGGKLFKVILFLPSIISSIVLITMYKFFADIAIPEIFHLKVHLLSDKSTAFGTVLFYNVWAGFGSSILLYSGAMANISDSVMEAAELDGVTPVKAFLQIVVPMIFPTLKTFLITGFTGLFISDMGLFSFFGTQSEKYLWTFGYYLLRGARASQQTDYPTLAAIGLMLTAVAVPLTLTFRRLLTKFGWSVD